MGLVRSRARAAVGRGPGSAATCFPARRGSSFLLPLLCKGRAQPTSPASGRLPRSGVRCCRRAPFSLSVGDRRVPSDSGSLVDRAAIRASGAARVGGAWAGNASPDRLVPGCVLAPSAARLCAGPGCASHPSPPQDLRRVPGTLRLSCAQELSSPKLEGMFSQAVVLEACVCVCVCVSVCPGEGGVRQGQTCRN